MAEEVKIEEVNEDPVEEIKEEPADGLYNSVRELVRKLDDVLNALDTIKQNTAKPERKPLPEAEQSKTEDRPGLLDM